MDCFTKLDRKVDFSINLSEYSAPLNTEIKLINIAVTVFLSQDKYKQLPALRIVQQLKAEQRVKSMKNQVLLRVRL